MENEPSYKDLLELERQITNEYLKSDEQGKNKIAAHLENCKQQENFPTLYANSLLFYLTKDRDYLIECLQILENSTMDLSLKHFYFTQTMTAHFASSLYENYRFTFHKFKAFISLLKEIKEALSLTFPHIPPQQRNMRKIVVLTKQFLGKRHGPTGDAIEIIQALTEKLDYEVTLINASELNSAEIDLWCNFKGANKLEKYNSRNSFPLDSGTTIKFYQNPQPMINLNEIQKMLDLIYNENPRFLICLGCPNITADLASTLTTVLSIPPGGKLPVSTSGNLLVPRELKSEDRELLNSLNMQNTALFSVQYVFRPPDVSDSNALEARTALDIPEGTETFAIIGTRFDDEITQEFCHTLEEIIQERRNSFFIFIGPFDHFSDRIENFPQLWNHSIALGYRRDVPELLQLCDYYLNPPRQGGATSVVCALKHGIPVFSQPCGDVAKQACREGYYMPWYTAKDIVSYLEAIDAGYESPALDPEVLQQRAATLTDRERQVTEFCEIAEKAIERQWENAPQE